MDPARPSLRQEECQDQDMVPITYLCTVLTSLPWAALVCVCSPLHVRGAAGKSCCSGPCARYSSKNTAPLHNCICTSLSQCMHPELSAHSHADDSMQCRLLQHCMLLVLCRQVIAYPAHLNIYVNLSAHVLGRRLALCSAVSSLLMPE